MKNAIVAIMKKKSPWIWIIIVAVVAVGLMIWGAASSSQSTEGDVATGKPKVAREDSSRDVAMLCTKDMFTEFHIHPKLSIIINGESQVIPANIGITPLCMKSLHTHDATGEIHVEAPVKRDFILGDFFAVWEQPFDATHIMNYVVDEDSEIIMTVNGKVVDTYENTPLVDKDKIVVEYKKK